MIVIIIFLNNLIYLKCNDVNILLFGNSNDTIWLINSIDVQNSNNLIIISNSRSNMSIIYMIDLQYNNQLLHNNIGIRK